MFRFQLLLKKYGFLSIESENIILKSNNQSCTFILNPEYLFDKLEIIIQNTYFNSSEKTYSE